MTNAVRVAIATALLALSACDAAPAPAPATDRPTATAVPAPSAPVVARQVRATKERVVRRAFGTAPGEFGRRAEGDLPTYVPRGVVVLPGGEIVVLDAVKNRLVRFDAAGRHLGDLAVTPRSKDVALDDLAYDPAGRRIVVLDTVLGGTVMRHRLVFVEGGATSEVLVEPPMDGMKLYGGYPVGVGPDGTVYAGVDEGASPLYARGAAVPRAARRPVYGMPAGTTFAQVDRDKDTVRVTTGMPGATRTAAVRLPHPVLDAQVLAEADGALWLFVNVEAQPERVESMVVRVVGDLSDATFFPVAYDPPGDVTRPAAVAPDGSVVVLTGAPGGMDVVRYRPAA